MNHTRKRILRWAAYLLGGLFALVVLLRIGAGIYLNTSSGRALVARQLSEIVGLPVEVREVKPGVASTTIAFRVLDRAQPQDEILAVESASVNSSIVGLAVGSGPSEVTLRGVHLTARLDADGKLLTSMPESKEGGAAGSLPQVHIEQLHTTIQQVGRPAFELLNASVHATPNGDRLAITGEVDDPSWGRLNAKGEVSISAGSGQVQLDAPAVNLTLERLRTLPALSSSLWDQVQPSGPATVSASIRFGEKLSYDLRIQSTSAEIGIPAAEISLSQAAVVVRIHDGAIEVSGEAPDAPATAKLAGGDVEVNAKWNFAVEPSVGDPLKLKVKRLAVKDLPAKWGLKNLGGALPGKVSIESGFLSGTASLKLISHADGRTEAFGGGRGRIDLPDFLGGSGSVGVKLGGTGKKLEFSPAPEPVSITNELELLAFATFLAVQPESEGTNLDARISLRDIDIAKFMEQLDLKLPYKLAGKVTVQAKFGVPLAEATSKAAYVLTGTLSSPELQLEGLTIRELSTEIVYKNNTLTLTHLRGRIPQAGDPNAEPGSFNGTASAVIDPPGRVSAKLQLERIPVSQVAAALPGFALPLTGIVNGQAEFGAPFDRLGDTTTWSASANLSCVELTVAGRHLRNLTIGAVVANGVVTLKDTAVTVEGIPITARGSLTLNGQYPFEATVRTENTRLTDLSKLMPEAELPGPIEGVLDTESKITGKLAPTQFEASGRITASKLTLGKATANYLDVKWSVNSERIRVQDLTATLFGGTFNGSLEYPFDPTKAGKFDLGFKDVDATAVTAFVPDVPVKITGLVTGNVKGDIAPAKAGASRIGNLDVDLTAPKLKVQNIPAERLTGSLTIRNGAIEYSLEGKALGGSFDLKGRYPGAKKDEKQPRGSLRIRDLDLARLGRDLQFDSLSPLRGVFDAVFNYDPDLKNGSGRISVRGFGWGNDEVAQDLDGVLLLDDGILELRELAGSIARGSLRARARVNLGNPARNFLSLTIDRADAARLFAPIPELNGITGQASLTIRATLGRTMRGSGTVGLARGGVAGLALDEVRIPFEFSTAPGGGGQLVIRELSTRAGTGRATGKLTLDWNAGGGIRVAGQVKFLELPLRVLSPSLGDNSFLGSGKLTGRFDLNGTNVRSVNDLSGTLIAVLNNTSVKELPLMQRTVPYLNPIGVTKPFQSGDVRATLSGGVFRINRLALANPGAQIFAEGTVRTTGAINLDVTAHTGQVGPDSRGLALLALRIPALGPIPIGLIRDVSAFLSNRTVRLSVTGTVSNPTVRVNTGALLAEEAVRFFLTRYALPPGAVEALGVGTAGSISGSNR